MKSYAKFRYVDLLGFWVIREKQQWGQIDPHQGDG